MVEGVDGWASLMFTVRIVPHVAVGKIKLGSSCNVEPKKSCTVTSPASSSVFTTKDTTPGQCGHPGGDSSV